MFQLIPVMGIALQGANVVGYVKCRRDAGAKITQMAGQFIGKQILKQVCVCVVCVCVGGGVHVHARALVGLV